MKILAFDPGKDNFAYCLLEDGEVKEHGFIETIESLEYAEFQSNMDAFIKHIGAFLKEKQLDRKTDWLVFERFMYRPGFGRGAVGEYTNIMIATITTIAKTKFKINTRLVTPPAWKTKLLKRNGEKITSQELFTCDATKHETDAMAIAAYSYEKEVGKAPCLK